MGMVFGKTSVAEPAFTVLSSHRYSSMNFEVRSYSQRFAIETTMTDSSGGFRTLAGFIGVGTNAKNADAMKISMTAPVSMYNTNENVKCMSFMLPAEFDSLDSIPKPNDPAIRVTSIPPSIGAVTTFSGWTSMEKAVEKRDELISSINGCGATVPKSAEWELWQYNPPFTIPMLRRNEVFVKLTTEQAESLEK